MGKEVFSVAVATVKFDKISPERVSPSFSAEKVDDSVDNTSFAFDILRSEFVIAHPNKVNPSTKHIKIVAIFVFISSPFAFFAHKM